MNNINHSQFNVNLESYEGPIDLLLDLAKNQKVDLSKISILKLAEQYLEYINFSKQKNLEIVSDYLVMAAWLTYLKSRFLLPKKANNDEPTTKELEEAVKFQLIRLEAMQNVSKELFSLPQVGTNVFYRGSSHGVKFKYKTQYTSSLFDLFTSYARQITRNELRIRMSELHSVENAIERLKSIFGNFNDWIEITKLLPALSDNILINKSALSSTLVASLELVKNGFIEVKQNQMFGPIFLKIK